MIELHCGYEQSQVTKICQFLCRDINPDVPGRRKDPSLVIAAKRLFKTEVIVHNLVLCRETSASGCRFTFGCRIEQRDQHSHH